MPVLIGHLPRRHADPARLTTITGPVGEAGHLRAMKRMLQGLG